MIAEENVAKQGDKRSFTHEVGHWLGLDDDYTKKAGGDPKKLMNNKGGRLITEPEKRIMFNQFTERENKGQTKIYRNADKMPLGSGNSKTDLKDLIDNENASATHR